MKILTFTMGAALRKVIINKKRISFLGAELNFVPLVIDLDNLEKVDKNKLSKEDLKTIKKLAKLGSEVQIAKDIIEDFKQTGWNLIGKK
ncbi:hypothetical protein LCGC14_0465950 [marine sediment metagenome]|uniref:Uncharacterized protein n=1 Tax=marine sediment metagenome TaxID=412755 RepID=A0A0F9V0J4_9ZZZZ